MQPPEAAISRKITLDRLYAFLAHPARFVIRQRLGIHLEEAVNVLEDCEPFQLEALTRYRIGDILLKHCLNGNDPQSLLPVFRAAGGMPHGRVGDYLFSQLSSEVRRFVSKAKSILPAPRATSLEFDADIDGFQLSVRLSELSERGCVQMRYADLTARDFIRWWLRHLGVCVGSPDPASLRSLLVGKDAAFVVGPVGQCRSVLSDLLRLYWQGLAEPVPFFPGPSLEYFRKLQTAERSSRRALASARQWWAGTDQRPGESEDPYNRLCHGGGDPLNDAFQRLSVQVFQPLFANAEQLPW
jgi:exodeoxyribonuclease V gamma subunit